MGVWIEGRSRIEFFNKINKSQKDMVKKALRKIEAYSIVWLKDPTEVSFDIGGNNCLDDKYEVLKELKAKLNKQGIKLLLSVSEFEEIGGGIYIEDEVSK